jgi:hypothetical protein
MNSSWLGIFIVAACSSLLLLRCAPIVGGTNIPDDIHDDDGGYARLVDWITSHGGRVDPRMTTVATTAGAGVRGVVATSAIRGGAELLFCPWSLIIGGRSAGRMDAGGGGGGLDEGAMCDVVREMAREMRLGDGSAWHPYLDHVEVPRLVATWGAEALGALQGLPPRREADRHLRWFDEVCRGGRRYDVDDDLDGDDATKRSLVAFVSRASEVGMIPLYDLLNHHNGKRNAKLSVTEEGVKLVAVVLDRDRDDGGASSNGKHHLEDVIEGGDEIYLSYGLKTASTMYRDYGFVEEWPTCWNFADPTSGDNFAFVSFPHGVSAINPTGEYLRSMWSANASLAEYEARARAHTESLSVLDLERFVGAARNRSREFPSTVGEDELILEGIRNSMSVSGGDGDDTSSVEDVVKAIVYRMAFKSALLGSASYAESIMANKVREITSNKEL